MFSSLKKRKNILLVLIAISLAGMFVARHNDNTSVFILFTLAAIGNMAYFLKLRQHILQATEEDVVSVNET